MSPDSPGAGRSDGELVLRVGEGDASAFDLLVQRYQRKATSIAYRLLSNVHDALEVVQDSFLKAYRSLETLEEPERFGPWFLRIVTNLSLNYRRGRAAGPRRVSLAEAASDGRQGELDIAIAPPHSDKQPGAALAAEELSGAIQQALLELPDQQRAALVLFSLEQMPQRDVAEMLDCSVEAVKWHVFQARKKLKEKLADFL